MEIHCCQVLYIIQQTLVKTARPYHTSEEVDRVAAEVLLYLLKPERCSSTYSESEDKDATVIDTSGEQ